jgi:predicted XRE-type DNA-binding protein
MAKQVDINIGDIFHELTVIEEVERWVYPSGDTRRQFLMQCSCGSPAKKMLISNFKTGSTKSCGCYNVKRMTTHGMHKTRQYQCWADMKTRCDSISNEFYDYYGGRGITYCDKWKTFEGFWEDMQEGYSDSLTINRRNNDGNYCKENCEWDGRNFQGHMRRKLRGTYLSVIGGIYDAKNDKMTARIKKDGKGIHLGNYKTEGEIAQAYDYASEIIYGDRPNKTMYTDDRIKLRVDKFMCNVGKDMRVSGCENENAMFTKEQIKEICILLDKGMFQKDIAKLYSTEQTTISSISRGKTYAKESGRDKTFKLKGKT